MAFLNTSPQTTQIPNFNPQQLQVLQQFLQQGSQGLQNNNFEPYANKARENFASKTLPLLAERFGALAGDSRGSSGLVGQLSGAGSELESSLGALGAQHDFQLNSLLAQLGLQPQNENIYEEEKPGFAETAGNTFLSKILPLLLKIGGGAATGFATGGPVGALGGAAVGAGSGIYDAYNAPSAGNTSSMVKNLGNTNFAKPNAFNFQQR